MAKRKKKGYDLTRHLEEEVAIWRRLDEAALVNLLIQECLTPTKKEGMDPEDIYRRVICLYLLFVERFSVAQRQDVEKRIVQSILDGAAQARALTHFIFDDPDLSVISTAALDYAVLREPTEKDGLFTGPRFLLSQAGEVCLEEMTRTGILMGLVLLGDRRLLPMLDGCWQLLGPEGRDSLTRTTSGYITAGLIDFFLMWLEQTDDEGNFGGIVGTLCRMPSVSTNGMVLDIERAFPAGSPDDPEGSGRILRTWTFLEYYKKIQRRLKKIEKRESEPKLIPSIATYWKEANAAIDDEDDTNNIVTLFNNIENLMKDSDDGAGEERDSDDIKEEDEEIVEQIIENGKVVYSLEWDSGGPEAGAGCESVYRWKGKFAASSLDDCDPGPFNTLEEALEANDGLWLVNSATGSIDSSVLSGKAIASRLECFAEDGYVIQINGQDWVYQAENKEFKRLRSKK